MRSAFLLLAPCLFFVAAVAAQPPAGFFEYFDTDDGLSHPEVTALFRDSRGFLWIGTVRGGLDRYDGHALQVYRHRDGDSLSLCHDDVRSILEDEWGFLWIGTGGGISCLNPANGKCRNFTQQNGRLAYNSENHLFQDAKGGIWTSNGGLERYDPETERFIPYPIGDTLRFGSLSAVDRKGRFWLGGWEGLKMLDPASGKIQRFLPNPGAALPELNAVSVRMDRSGNIWILTWGTGLLRFDPEASTFEKFIWQPDPKSSGYNNIAFDVAETYDAAGKHSFWVATEDGVFRFFLDPKGFPSLDLPHDFFETSPSGPMKSGQVRVLFNDGQGSLWIGGHTGLSRFNTRQDNFRTFKKTVPGTIEKVNFTRNGDALISFIGQGAPPLGVLDADFARKKPKLRLPAAMDPLRGGTSWEAVKDEESGVIYVATFDGLLAYDDKAGTTRWFSKKDGDSTSLVGRKITNLFPLGGGRLLLATWGMGMQVFDVNTGKSMKYLGKYGLLVRNIRKLSHGDIWICAEGNLMKFDTQALELVYVTPNPNLKYYDIHEDAQGRTWLATERGLFRYDLETGQITAKYGTEQGLPHQWVQGICEDRMGRLWLITEYGVCYFDPEMRRCYVMGQPDGLLFKNKGGVMAQSADGSIWLAFGDNLQVFRPELVGMPPPSRCYLTGLKINERDTVPDRPFERLAEIRLLPGQDALTFTYTAIDLESLGKTNFLYRLEGLQTDWVRAGKERTARYVNLPAGEYVFRVRPEDAGEDASRDAVLRVVVTNHVWQRTWFKNLMIVLVMASMLGMARYYYRSRLRLQQAEATRREAIESTRSQIAQDIHDDLGTDLSKISLGASVAAMMPELDPEALREKLLGIGADTQAVAQHLRDVVFITNPRFDAFSEVQAYFREKSREFLEHVGLEPHFDFPKPERDPAVPPEVKRQLFLLLREGLNNAAKHAGATELHLVFRLQSDNSYTLEIRDNGRGFDPENTGQFGNGLRGMAARAEKIGAKWQLNTAPGLGTSIRLVGSL